MHPSYICQWISFCSIDHKIVVTLIYHKDGIFYIDGKNLTPEHFGWLRDWEEWMTGKCWISNWTNIWVDWQLVSQIYMSGCFLFSLLIYTIVCVCALYKIYISRDFYEWRLWQLDQMEQLTSKNQKLWTSERYRSRVLNSLYSYLQQSIIFIPSFAAKIKTTIVPITFLFDFYKEKLENSMNSVQSKCNKC